MKRAYYLLFAVSCLILSGCAVKTPVVEPEPTQLPEPGVTISQVNLYHILEKGSEDDYTGAKAIIGCEQSMVPVPVKSSIHNDSKYQDLRSLLSSYDGGNTNIINPRKAQTRIAFSSFEIRGSTLAINLVGGLEIKDNCQLSSLVETIKANYRQFDFEDVEVYLDGKTIDTLGQN